jgi:hypothetical protein
MQEHRLMRRSIRLTECGLLAICGVLEEHGGIEASHWQQPRPRIRTPGLGGVQSTGLVYSNAFAAQEERKVEVLSARLLELGVDPETLLEGLNDAEEGEEDVVDTAEDDSLL